MPKISLIPFRSNRIKLSIGLLIISSLALYSFLPKPLILKYKVEGYSFQRDITLKTHTYTARRYFDVDWGDGTYKKDAWGDPSHKYAEEGEYTVKVYGNFGRVYLVDDDIISLEQWGSSEWEILEHVLSRTFEDRNKVFINATDTPNITKVTNARSMFTDYNGPSLDLHNWDVSNIENMELMFSNFDLVNAKIDRWDVSSVKLMAYMFQWTKNFNEDLSSWDTSSVTDMEQMFFYAESFNSDISQWNTSSVVDMSGMFRGATSFNGNISEWDISSVKYMTNMFREVTLDILTYDSILNGWSKQKLNKNVHFHAGESQYSIAAVAARNILVDKYKWVITDGGLSNDNRNN